MFAINKIKIFKNKSVSTGQIINRTIFFFFLLQLDGKKLQIKEKQQQSS